jgi:hypothetical protein
MNPRAGQCIPVKIQTKPLESPELLVPWSEFCPIATLVLSPRREIQSGSDPGNLAAIGEIRDIIETVHPSTAHSDGKAHHPESITNVSPQICHPPDQKIHFSEASRENAWNPRFARRR